jgi:hypothetical protein
MEHPYKEFEGLIVWQTIDKAIAELEENQDLVLKTPREYVIGYLCKTLIEESRTSKNRLGEMLAELKSKNDAPNGVES